MFRYGSTDLFPTQSGTISIGLRSSGEVSEILIHDRDSIFSPDLDASIRNLRLRVLKTPYRTPQANAIYERFIGTARRLVIVSSHPLSNRSLVRPWI